MIFSSLLVFFYTFFAWLRAQVTRMHLHTRASGAGGAFSGSRLLEALRCSVWLALPKRKTSYAKKRVRQMSPHYARKELNNFYPCPKCEKGLLKLRHHICPCDQLKLNVAGVKQVRKKSFAGCFFFFLRVALF